MKSPTTMAADFQTADLMKKGLRLAQVRDVDSGYFQTADLMKKGLRPESVDIFLNPMVPNSRPDEEGIETYHGG